MGFAASSQYSLMGFHSGYGPSFAVANCKKVLSIREIPIDFSGWRDCSFRHILVGYIYHFGVSKLHSGKLLVRSEGS